MVVDSRYLISFGAALMLMSSAWAAETGAAKKISTTTASPHLRIRRFPFLRFRLRCLDQRQQVLHPPPDPAREHVDVRSGVGVAGHSEVQPAVVGKDRYNHPH